MLRHLLPMAAACMTACSGEPEANKGGWTSGENRYRHHVRYVFADEPDSYFAGTCDSTPVFALVNGDYAADARVFDLFVDDGFWTVSAVGAGHQGRLLPVDDPEVVRRIAGARKRIVFRVGQWSREVPAHPMLARFAAECAARRKIDPEAKGLSAAGPTQ